MMQNAFTQQKSCSENKQKVEGYIRRLINFLPKSRTQSSLSNAPIAIGVSNFGEF